MGAHRRKATVSLDDAINILDKNAVEDSPAKQVFKAASAILALVWVSAVSPCVHCCLTIIQQDKMINDKDFVQLSESCPNVYEVLDAAIQGKKADDLDESVRAALEDSERYFDYPWPCRLTIPSEPRVLHEIERALRRRASTPHSKHEKENIEGHMLEINRILSAISKNGLFLPHLR